MTSATRKIHSRYNAEHDVNPDPKAPRVTWAEEELAHDIDKLFEKIEQLEKMLKETTALPIQLINKKDTDDGTTTQRIT